MHNVAEAELTANNLGRNVGNIVIADCTPSCVVNTSTRPGRDVIIYKRQKSGQFTYFTTKCKGDGVITLKQ